MSAIKLLLQDAHPRVESVNDDLGRIIVKAKKTIVIAERLVAMLLATEKHPR